jgi:hypothetical protein
MERRRAYIARFSLSILIFITGFFTVSAQEKLIAGSNNKLSVNAFSIYFPDKYLQKSAQWTISKKNDTTSLVDLDATDEKGIPVLAYTIKKYSMTFFMFKIWPDSMRLLTNDSIAAKYFDQQLKIMMDDDAKYKYYAIRDHKTGTDSLNGKLFYTYTYAIQNKAKNYVLMGYLYMYFPKESENEYIFVALFKEPVVTPTYTKTYTAKWLGCFREILYSLQMKQ